MQLSEISEFLLTNKFWQSCLAAMLLLSASNAPLNAKTADKLCLQIQQKSKFCGDVEIAMDTQALRMHFKNSNTYLVSKAPDWTVYKFNHLTKKYCAWRYNEYRNKLAETRAMMGSPSNVDVHVHRTGSKTFDAYDAHIYASNNDYYKKVEEMYKTHEITGNYPNNIEVTTIECADCTPEEAHILNIALAIPQTKELPIASRGIGCDGKTYLYLTTAKMTRTAPPTDLTSIPTTYKKVADETKMMADETLNQNFVDFLSVSRRPSEASRAVPGK